MVALVALKMVPTQPLSLQLACCATGVPDVWAKHCASLLPPVRFLDNHSQREDRLAGAVMELNSELHGPVARPQCLISMRTQAHMGVQCEGISTPASSVVSFARLIQESCSEPFRRTECGVSIT